jgi:hypothetical protein
MAMVHRGDAAQAFTQFPSFRSSEIVAWNLESHVGHCCGSASGRLLLIQQPCVIQYEMSLHRQDSDIDGMQYKTPVS